MVHLAQNGTIGFDPQPHVYFAFSGTRLDLCLRGGVDPGVRAPSAAEPSLQHHQAAPDCVPVVCACLWLWKIPSEIYDTAVSVLEGPRNAPPRLSTLKGIPLISQKVALNQSLLSKTIPCVGCRKGQNRFGPREVWPKSGGHQTYFIFSDSVSYLVPVKGH